MKKVKIGNCILFLGDCLDIMPKFPAKKLDLILCDLPYGITRAKWDCIIPFDALWNNYVRLVKERTAIVLTASQPFTTKLIASNLPLFRYCWVWEKSKPTGFTHAKMRPLKQHEDIAVFSLKPTMYYPQNLIRIDRHIKPQSSKQGELLVGGNLGVNDYIQEFTNYPKSILHFSSVNTGHAHPTQKPVPLMKYLIKTYSLENQYVMDNCMGSGATGVACVQTNRKFIGIEQNKDYFDIACDRINDAVKASNKSTLFRKKSK